MGRYPEPPTVGPSPSILLQETADGPMTLQGVTHEHTRMHSAPSGVYTSHRDTHTLTETVLRFYVVNTFISFYILSSKIQCF